MKAIKQYKISMTIIVPPILTSLSKSKNAGFLKSLRLIHVGGSCATDGMQQQLYQKLHPNARILQVYGMTETGWATTWQEMKNDKSGSVGRPLPGTRFRLVDHDGVIVKKDGVHGEIHIEAPHPMKGYLNNDKATREAFTEDGWIRSGDVGFVKEGRWYVIDRTKDLIKVRGWQVSPAEIEAVLLEHPEIMDAAVIGTAAQDGEGEVPLGFIVRKEGSKIQAEEVKAFLGTRLARYKGVHTVSFIDRIPRNPTGKILRRVLRDTRERQPPTPDEALAVVYSNAIQDMERYRKKRDAEKRARVVKENAKVVRPRSRSVSLTDASTIEGSAPPSPILSQIDFEPSIEVRKRKGMEVESTTAKRRRSTRFVQADARS